MTYLPRLTLLAGVWLVLSLASLPAIVGVSRLGGAVGLLALARAGAWQLGGGGGGGGVTTPLLVPGCLATLAGLLYTLAACLVISHRTWSSDRKLYYQDL